MVTIVSIEKVRGALERAEQLGAGSIEEACNAAAAALALPVEAVREVMFGEVTDAQVQGADSMAAPL